MTRIKLNKKLTVGGGDFDSGDFNAAPSWLYGLWFQFLQLSPSYELARRYREKKGRLSAADKARLPEDFDQVLKVFDDFGDVQRAFFKPWLQERGLPLFGEPGSRPKTRTMFRMTDSPGAVERAPLKLQEYLERYWTAQNRPDIVVVAIPIHQSITQARKDIARTISLYVKGKKKTSTAKYTLLGKGMHKKSLKVTLDQLHVRTMYPEMKLWELGLYAGVSKTYCKLYGQKTERTASNYEDLRRVEMMTSRQLKIARWIAENAARGKFPDKSQPTHAVEFDVNEFHEIFKARVMWAKEARKEYETEE